MKGRGFERLKSDAWRRPREVVMQFVASCFAGNWNRVDAYTWKIQAPTHLLHRYRLRVLQLLESIGMDFRCLTVLTCDACFGRE
jgi:hypothetical protein